MATRVAVFFLCMGIPLELTVDSSGVASQAVLLIDGDDGTGRLPQLLGSMLDAREDGHFLGLTAAADCAAPQPLVPISRGNDWQLRKAFAALPAAGKSDLAAGLRKAAAQLLHTEHRGTIYVFTHGGPLCGDDPCAVAQALEASGADFSIQVMALADDASDAEPLRCLAEATGGSYASAAALPQLQTQLAELVASATDLTPAELRVSARFAGSGRAVDTGVVWEVYDVNDDPGGGAPPITYSYNPRAAFRLPPGTYRVVSSLGRASSEQIIDFGLTGAGKVSSHALEIAAGRLHADASLSANGETIDTPLKWVAYRSEIDEQGQRQAETFSEGVQADFILPVGDYWLQATLGEITQGQSVRVQADSISRVTVNLKGGRLRLNARVHADAPPLREALNWQLFRAEEFGRAIAVPVATRSANDADWLLPAGDYVISAKQDLAHGVSRISLAAGADVEHSVNLHAAHLALNARLVDGGNVLNDRINWTVEALRAQSGVANLARAQLKAAEFLLTAGHYRVTAQIGAATVRAEYLLAEGERRRETLNLDAGFLHLSAEMTAGKPVKRRHILDWEIRRPGRSEVFARSQGNEVQFLLPAGRYRVTGRFGSASRTEDVVIRAGRPHEQMLQLNAGQLDLLAADANGRPLLVGVDWTVHALASNEKIAVEYGSSAKITLPAGEYQVSAQRAGKGQASQRVTVAAGSVVPLMLSLE